VTGSTLLRFYRLKPSFAAAADRRKLLTSEVTAEDHAHSKDSGRLATKLEGGTASVESESRSAPKWVGTKREGFGGGFSPLYER
jgi:hypothetical protein